MSLFVVAPKQPSAQAALADLMPCMPYRPETKIPPRPPAHLTKTATVLSWDHAVARGAKIYAELAGGGLSADAHHLTAPHPEGLGALNVMRNCLEDAGLRPEDVDYVNVHGTSTPLGDIAETKAIQGVFGEHAYRLNISSTKSMTGHLLGAAGAAEALVACLSVVHDIVPPTINHFTDDPELDDKLNFTFNVAQKRIVRAALSNTFGFGGHNASVLFKKVV